MNRVIASATRACSVASASSRSRRAFRVAIFRSRTELRPGGFGEGLVGDPRPATWPFAVPFPTGGMLAFLAFKPDFTEPELSQLGSALSNTPDEDGLEFPGLDAAEREAARAAAEIGRDRLPKGEAREIVIEVRNKHKRRLLTVTVSLKVERVHPLPVTP